MRRCRAPRRLSSRASTDRVTEPGTTPFEPRFFETPDELRRWLDANHETATELFVGSWKKSTGRPALTWEQIVDEALCVGWIDGIRRGLPGDGWSIRLTPRRKGSTWSAVNVRNVERLRAAGRMRPAGEAEFLRRTDERTAIYSYERRDEAQFDEEETAAFRADARAWMWWESQSASFRATATYWVVSPKRPETRTRRLATLIADAAAGRKPKPLRPLAEQRSADPPG